MDKFSSTILLRAATYVTKISPLRILLLGSLCFFLCSCVNGVYHTVKPGQTLYRISKTYQVDEGYLARANGISDPTQISVGSQIFIPGADRVLRVPVVNSPKPTASPVAVKKKKRVTPRPRAKVKAPKASTTKAKPTRKVKPHATSVKRLQWPLRGKIVRSFTKKAKAGRGRGIEIAARSGTPVVAAEAGKVIYSGAGVSGYAFLVILQHENDLFTVYGFNRKNLVKQGDFVSRGERIALSGTPPSGGQPRLHFEVRKGKVAVNPISYLP
jgi:lipoprotein NlpD